MLGGVKALRTARDYDLLGRILSIYVLNIACCVADTAGGAGEEQFQGTAALPIKFLQRKRDLRGWVFKGVYWRLAGRIVLDATSCASSSSP